MKPYLVTIFVIVCYFRSIQTARLARNCQSKWNQGAQCQKDGLSRAGENDNNYPIPNDGNKKIIMNSVDSCFRNTVGCKKSPVLSAQQSSDTSSCFNQAKQSLVGQLEQCAKKCVEDFSMPVDIYDPITDWNNFARLLRNVLNGPASYCGLGKKKQLNDCVKQQTGYDFSKKPPNMQPAYVCQVDADCWYNLGPDCQNTWEYQAIPQLCQCSQSMQQQNAVKSTQNQYKACLKSRGITAAKDDPVLKWIDNYLRGMCANAQTHPCRREREIASRRQTWQRSG